MLRYHSFCAWHRHDAYSYLCNEQDRAMLPWVLKFVPTISIPKMQAESQGNQSPTTISLRSSSRRRSSGSQLTGTDSSQRA